MNKGGYPDDIFTEADVLRELSAAGLKHKNGGRYILSQCPLHEDAHPSVQIYKDDWFASCHAGCGRFHITKAFPNLRPRNSGVRPEIKRSGSVVVEHQYKTFDLTDLWKSMSAIPDDHVFKGIPIDVLTELGWRYDAEHNRYFIPYFSASMQSIPFAQWRNLGDGPRFNFWKDAKPTMYGTWNLDNQKLFLVEGASDAAVLEYAAVPWIAAPSAASGELVKLLAAYCKQNDITIVYAGDNDSAGSKLREALDEVATYRVKQPPTKYKDWGDFLVAEGVEAITDYCFPELSAVEYDAPPVERFSEPVEVDDSQLTTLEDIQKVFPTAKELVTVTDPPASKELSDGSVQPLF